MPYCIHCGASVGEEDRFCSACGRLAQAETPARDGPGRAPVAGPEGGPAKGEELGPKAGEAATFSAAQAPLPAGGAMGADARAPLLGADTEPKPEEADGNGWQAATPGGTAAAAQPLMPAELEGLVPPLAAVAKAAGPGNRQDAQMRSDARPIPAGDAKDNSKNAVAAAPKSSGGKQKTAVPAVGTVPPELPPDDVPPPPRKKPGGNDAEYLAVVPDAPLAVAKAGRVPRAPAENPASGGGAKRVVLVLCALAVFAAAVFGLVAAILWHNNSADRLIDDFTAAIEAGDTAALEEMYGTRLRLQGVANLRDWAPLLTLLGADGGPAALRTQLEQEKQGETGLAPYPVIRLKSEPLFLFVDRWYIEIEAASVLLEEFEAGAQLALNGQALGAGQAESAGVLYTGLMPGRYDYAITTPSGFLAEGRLDLVHNSPPARVLPGGPAGDARPLYTVTLGNLPAGSYTLYVNGEPVDAPPVEGLVTLLYLPLGSEIRLVLQTPGEPWEAVLTFDDPAATHLDFPDYVPDPANDPEGFAAAATPEEMSTVLAAYYPGYFAALGGADPAGMTHCTNFNVERLREELTAEEATHSYTFVSAEIMPDSLVASADEGRPALAFNVRVTYLATPLEGGDAVEVVVNHSVQLVYQDGTWLVNRMDAVSDEAFAANQLADFAARDPAA